ncbi:MAG TPA: 50S ribosomal protein L13 [Bacteroidales bacterium]|jgi:large subunit ribosomal protein L13|nr:50S ribosomal protein L13 [Bacteroidales bacterium]
MDTLSYKTLSATPDTIKKEWYVVNAENEILGRLASKVAKILRGKYKPSYTPNLDCGDNVIIINAEKITITGAKWTDKEYVRHSGYPGGQSKTTPKEMLAKKPGAIIEKAVRGMLPKNRLGDALFRNLKVYAGPEHKHEAQLPKPLNLNSIK